MSMSRNSVVASIARASSTSSSVTTTTRDDNSRGMGGGSSAARSAIGRKRKPSATASVGSAAKLLKRADGDKKQEAKHKAPSTKEEHSNSVSTVDAMSVDADTEGAVDTPNVVVEKPMSLDDIPSGLKCTLSGQLMAAPVVMNDGNKYDLKIIENLIKETEINGKQLKSPVTGNRMNKASKNPCNDTLANIEQLVDSDAIEKEIADDWRRRRNEVKFEAGDMSAAVELGREYMGGKNGCKKDPKKAFRWFKKAADKLDRKGLYWAAMCYVSGTGIRENETAAIQLMSLAATHTKGGYGKAVYRLAQWNYEGSKGSLDELPRNLHLAEYFSSTLCQEKYDTHYEPVPDNWKQDAMKWMKNIRKKKSKN